MARIRTIVFLVSILIAFSSLTNDVIADDLVIHNSNAEVISRKLNVRSKPPKFSIKTLITFKFELGEILDTLEKGTRVRVEKIKKIGNHEWVEITYIKNGKEQKGWVYSGPVGDRKYLKIDNNERLSFFKKTHLPSFVDHTFSNLVRFNPLSPSEALAQTNNNRSINDTASDIDEKGATADKFKTLFLSVIYVVIFLLSLLFSKKFIFTSSNFYNLAIAVCILFILGLISQTTFANILTSYLSK